MSNAPDSRESRPYFRFVSVVLLVVAIVLLVIGIAVGMEMIRASGKIIQFKYKDGNVPVTTEPRGAK